MAEVQRIRGDLTVEGSVAVVGLITGNMARPNLILETGIYSVPLVTLRVHDAIQTNLPGTGAVDDLGITSGTIGTAVPHLRTADLNGGAGNGSYYARFNFTLPAEYVAGQTITLRVIGGMLTSVAATSATVDAVAYLSAENSLITGSDLCTTALISINSLTFANCDFTITPTGLVAGNTLDIRIVVAATSATGSSHFASIARIQMLLGIRG